MTALHIALFDAGFGNGFKGATRLAESLQQILAESGIAACVMSLDTSACDIDLSVFDSIFLRGLGRSAAAGESLEDADDALRTRLHRAEIAYQVIYGNDEESLEQLRRAIETVGTTPPVTTADSRPKTHSTDASTPWVWLCDKCSDPQCEHRLLTDLLQQRQTRL